MRCSSHIGWDGNNKSKYDFTCGALPRNIECPKDEMPLTRRKFLLSSAGLPLCAFAASFAQAQDYPTHIVRLVVAFPAGGPTDFVARLIANKLNDLLGQNVIIDNKPGAMARSVRNLFPGRSPTDIRCSSRPSARFVSRRISHPTWATIQSRTSRRSRAWFATPQSSWSNRIYLSLRQKNSQRWQKGSRALSPLRQRVSARCRIWRSSFISRLQA
jgi:hypothetical protein